MESCLVDLLRLGILSKATDPRDLVYALLGLVDRSRTALPEVDDSLTVVDVYKQAPISCLAASEPYTVLSLVPADDVVPQMELPS